MSDGKRGSSSVAFSSNMSNGTSNSFLKYGGLIHRSPYKKFRNAMTQLFNYMFNVAPFYKPVHLLIMVLRVLQLVGPCLVESFDYWAVSSPAKGTVDVVSVFYHYMPPSAREGDNILFFCYFYATISALVLIVVAASAFYYGKAAKLPILISKSIILYFVTFHLILHPVALHLLCEYVSKVLFVDGFEYNLAVVVLVSTLVLIICFCYSWLQMLIITQTLTFRPTSLMTTMVWPQNILYIGVLIINAITGFLSNCPETVALALLVLTAVIYGGLAFLPFYQGGFVNQMHGAAISACSITGAIMCLIIAVDKIAGFGIGLPLVFVLIILLIILVLVMKIVMTRISLKNYVLLDLFADGDVDGVLKNVQRMINVSIDGMRSSHPSCISWNVFKEALNLWHRDVRCWFIFAKFCSIYPEDSTTITWIYHSVLAAKLKGPTARTIKEQCLSISRQRESNLSPGLKIKLNTAQKEVTSSKHKLRHIWDLAIQGNVGEMESSIKRFYKDQEKADSEFKHLFRQYPNNRFVTRAYARFCKELKADINEYNQNMELSRALQRCVTVNEDMTHKLGILAFPSLPLKHPMNKTEINSNTDMNHSSSMDLTETDDDNLIDEAVSNTLHDTIMTLKIPSIVCTKITRFAMLIVLFVFPMILLFFMSSNFIDNLVGPLEYLEAISLLNSKAAQMVIFQLQYFYESLGVYNKTISQDTLPSSLGSSYDTKDMLLYIVAKTTMYTQNMFQFRSFVSTNKYILKAQEMLFQNTFVYYYLKSPNESISFPQSVQTCINDFVTQITSLLNEPVILPEFMNSSYLLNLIKNNRPIYFNFDDVLNLFVNFFKDNDTETIQLSNILMIAGIILTVLAFIVALVVQILWIQSTKEEAYKCLTALPKNAVSALVENLRVLKSDENNDSTSNTDTEINKQEDNIMKILVTGGDSSGNKMADRAFLVVGSLITIACEVISIYMFASLYKYESNRLYVSAPHMSYLSAVYIQAVSAYFNLRMVSVKYINHEAQIPILNINDVETFFEERIVLFRDYYHKARFGGQSPEDVPFAGFQDGVEKADSIMKCEDQAADMNNLMDLARCYNIEGVFVLFDYVLITEYYNHKFGGTPLTPDNPKFDYVWTLLINPIYDGLFAPMFGTIIPTIEKELKEKKNSDYPILIVLLIFGVVFEVAVFVQVLNIEKHIRSVLLLLLHCQQTTVMSTAKAVTVLQGNFSKSKGDIGKRNAEFYDSVFKLLPDAVLICNQMTYLVTAASKSCERVFQKTEEELLGMNIKEVLASDQFVGDCDSAFKGKEVNITSRDREGSVLNLEVTTMKVSNDLAVVIKDVTGTMRYNKLIQDERAKSDALLASILPPSLVQRVQAGEKNISFAVQSASILFLDIVSFTPWCGANEATKVMMTLNLMFKKLDFSLSQYTTMTKIKCIGDCYMAAGGIFAEINNPTEHAKEVVSFGLDSLECVRQLDDELGESLQIRVGINTGGPIVAGVLGIGKPTFEILGPAINMAQQMEHHGVPMKVHISRPVYELIYGEPFKIKERGSIEIKNGSCITYLLDERKQAE